VAAAHATERAAVRFISPSRGKRDSRQPLGVARHDFKCEFRVEATPDDVEIMPIDFADCAKEHVVPVPRCGFAAVWKKAIAKKAPSRNAVGNVDYRSNGSRPVWYFDIGFGTDVVFSEMFGDDCSSDPTTVLRRHGPVCLCAIQSWPALHLRTSSSWC